MMEVSFRILCTVLLFRTAMLKDSVMAHPGFTPCWAKQPGQAANKSILIYDSDGDACLNATFGFRLQITEHLTYEVDTSEFKGLCEQSGVLNGEEILGPAILFTWNTTGCSHDSLLIQWQIDKDYAFISGVDVSLSNPYEYYRIEKELRDLHLFETEVGDTGEIKEESLQFGRNEDFIFCRGNFKIMAASGPITLFVIGGIAFGVVITAGIFMYCKGTRKKLVEEPKSPC